ncbi:MAG: ABC transporter permease subunit [Candidatus Eremiobacteraeota bacterium]|nr:ABC transporter permease subunit [Candidatus Eremiobacteraeota bacterium]MBV8366715.1 ABC transporter permease subunit [Candidatus Eremiobacteraeota bacterium]
MAIDAIAAKGTSQRVAPPLPAALFGACAGVLCVSVVAIVGWLILIGVPNAVRVFNPHDPAGVLAPLIATAYVTILALPPAAIVGVFAAMAAADVRVFGSVARAMRNALTLVGSVPTVIVAFAALLAALSFGWHPSLTGAALAVSIINMPLMTALSLGALTYRAAAIREATTALGASPMYVVVRVLLPRAYPRLRGALILVATQIVGAAAAIAIVAGAQAPGGHGSAPIGAWPLAVEVLTRGSAASGYGATAAAALVLTILIWVLQGVAQLRASAESAAQEDR